MGMPCPSEFVKVESWNDMMHEEMMVTCLWFEVRQIGLIGFWIWQHCVGETQLPMMKL